jgi:hypothetical protein
MKFKACAISSLFLFGTFAPLFISLAYEPSDPDTSPLFRHADDQEVRAAMLMDKSKIVSSNLKTPALQEENRTEKRSTALAEPQDTLHGLKGVMVFIEDIDSDVENHGLTKNVLKKEVESRLRQADVPVLTVGEAFNTPGKPYLYLNLTTHNTGLNLYSYSVRIEFNQDVFLSREPSIRTSVTTWIANMGGIVGARTLPAVTEDVCGLTDKFIHDYVSANRQ